MQKSRGLHVPHQKATAKVCVAKHEATAGFEQVGEKKRKSNQTTPSIIPDITVEHTVFVFCKRQKMIKRTTPMIKLLMVRQMLYHSCCVCIVAFAKSTPLLLFAPTIPVIQRRSQ